MGDEEPQLAPLLEGVVKLRSLGEWTLDSVADVLSSHGWRADAAILRDNGYYSFQDDGGESIAAVLQPPGLPVQVSSLLWLGRSVDCDRWFTALVAEASDTLGTPRHHESAGGLKCAVWPVSSAVFALRCGMEHPLGETVRFFALAHVPIPEDDADLQAWLDART